MTSILIPPYGDQLVDLLVPPEALDDLKAHASALPSVLISERSECDLELLATGAFSPLDRFMGREDHQRVLDEMRLADGHCSPSPSRSPYSLLPTSTWIETSPCATPRTNC